MEEKEQKDDKKMVSFSQNSNSHSVFLYLTIVSFSLMSSLPAIVRVCLTGGPCAGTNMSHRACCACIITCMRHTQLHLRYVALQIPLRRHRRLSYCTQANPPRYRCWRALWLPSRIPCARMCFSLTNRLNLESKRVAHPPPPVTSSRSSDLQCRKLRVCSLKAGAGALLQR